MHAAEKESPVYFCGHVKPLRGPHIGQAPREHGRYGQKND
jgi:hypothetical protein